MSALLPRLRRALADGRLQPLELAQADWALRHGADDATALAWVLASRALAEGHTCLDLTDLAPALPGEAPFCDATRLRGALEQSPLVGEPGAARPLILEGERLYLHRYWHYETALAQRLRTLLAAPPEAVDTAALQRGGLFDYDWIAADATHWQPVAAAVALRHRLSILSGGPGTGKTYTVMRLLRLLVERARDAGEPAPTIRLAAPTGKAAARMMDSVRAGLATLPEATRLEAALPGEAHTLHRLLGLRPASVRPRYDRTSPLPVDAVIVDEASMVDLPLMAKLADALPDHARLILLGDRFQLASVESGSVLAELCGAAGLNTFTPGQHRALAPLLGTDAPAPAHDAGPLADHVVTLQTSHRFHPESAIGQLAAAINAGDGDQAVARASAGHEGVECRLDQAETAASLAETLTDAYIPLAEADGPEAALDALDAVRLLTATRVGPCGSAHYNRLIHDRLARRQGRDPDTPWYHGRPVIVLQNDYRAGLFNGDTGVCLADTDGALRVWFRTAHGVRALPPAALPAHDTVYAMTVHKSQGSEFNRVHLLLPGDEQPLLNRELLYTGITRARNRIILHGSTAALRAAAQRRTRRDSGLAERLTDTR